MTTIGAGEYHNCANNDTEIFCWGADDYGQLGDELTGTSTHLPQAIITKPWEN
jgi:alpha-tubulin suppressor-like RCC1 family protein